MLGSGGVPTWPIESSVASRSSLTAGNGAPKWILYGFPCAQNSCAFISNIIQRMCLLDFVLLVGWYVEG